MDQNLMTIGRFLKNKIKKRLPTLVSLTKLILIDARMIWEKILKFSFIRADNDRCLKIIKLSEYANIFCGYYDVSPFKPDDNDKILLHATKISAYSEASINESVDIILYTISTDEFVVVDQTNAWNWQQGSRLQWLDTKHIAYNVIKHGEVRCKILNIEDGSNQILPISISIIDSKGRVISIDYPALTKGSEYGYVGIEYVENSSIIKIYDPQANSVEDMFDWKLVLHNTSNAAERHHINHILPSPTNKYLIFIYRYWVGDKRYDSLMVFNFETRAVKSLIKDQVVSHYCWRDDSSIFAWLVIDNEPGYYFVDVITGEAEFIFFRDDGHPSRITDTIYITDRQIGNVLCGNQLVAEVLDLGNKRSVQLIRLSHPWLKDHSQRADMHISLSGDREKYQLDSRHIPDERTIIVGFLRNHIEDLVS